MPLTGPKIGADVKISIAAAFVKGALFPNRASPPYLPRAPSELLAASSRRLLNISHAAVWPCLVGPPRPYFRLLQKSRPDMKHFWAAKSWHARLRGKKLARLSGGWGAADYFFQKFAGPCCSPRKLRMPALTQSFLLWPGCRLQSGAPALQEKLARLGGGKRSSLKFLAMLREAEPAPPSSLFFECRARPRGHKAGANIFRSGRRLKQMWPFPKMGCCGCPAARPLGALFLEGCVFG